LAVEGGAGADVLGEFHAASGGSAVPAQEVGDGVFGAGVAVGGEHPAADQLSDHQHLGREGAVFDGAGVAECVDQLDVGERTGAGGIDC